MINRKALARASSSPGKTRVINFYNVENVLRFVDLPGYGYARVSREISGSWGGMIESYLKGRASLKGVVLVLDLRRVPSEDDLLMYNWLKCYDIHVITAVTKADKVKRSAIRKNAENARQRLELAESEPLVVFSSETKAGKNELWSLIEDSISFN
jgi:GTP-binding protein